MYESMTKNIPIYADMMLSSDMKFMTVTMVVARILSKSFLMSNDMSVRKKFMLHTKMCQPAMEANINSINKSKFENGFLWCYIAINHRFHRRKETVVNS